MTEKVFATPLGTIHYFVSDELLSGRPYLVFLPGLTADHRLFDRQIEYFEPSCNVLVWDAPGHSSSWPFELNFALMDKAEWLCRILEKEGFSDPVIIGQSMGGYVGQCFAQKYPGKLRGFVAIDSAPLQRENISKAEIWLLKRMEGTYRKYPWKRLLKDGTEGVAETEYGRRLMREMMMEYDGNQARYARLAAHGYIMLAEAYEADLPYAIDCPALLICGEKDRAGSTKRYNRMWHEKTGIPIEWIGNAGHNSNTDSPEYVNRLIEKFLKKL